LGENRESKEEDKQSNYFFHIVLNELTYCFLKYETLTMLSDIIFNDDFNCYFGTRLLILGFL